MSQHLRGIFALLIVTMVWGTTFPAMKDLTAWFPPVWIIFIRFISAGVLLSPFLLRAKWDDVRIGLLLGVLLFVCFLLQVEGLALTSANRNAFIVGLNVLVVPLFGIVAGKWPERRIVVAILMAVAGLFLLCWEGGNWGVGDMLALASAFAYGLYVKMMELGTRRAGRLLTLTVVQILTVAVLALIWLWLVDVPQTEIDIRSDLPNYSSYILEGLRRYWVNLAYLSLVATAAIIALQTWGQHHASANEAAVIYAFEPACAAIAAYFWVGEAMTIWGVLGAALMIAGMIVSQWQHAQEKVLLVPD